MIPKTVKNTILASVLASSLVGGVTWIADKLT